MKTSEVAKLLVMAKAIDDRMTVDEARVIMWELSLLKDMPLEFGQQAIARHYAESEKAIMPVHLNDRWKNSQERRKQQNLAKALEPQITRVPMPQEIKDLLAELRKSKSV